MSLLPLLDASGSFTYSNAGANLSQISDGSFNLNHTSNALVLAHITQHTTNGPLTVITCGGVNMNLVFNTGSLYVYSLFRTAAANETIYFSGSGTTITSISIAAFSIKNCSITSPYIEGATGSSSGSVILAPGTPNRLAIYANGNSEYGTNDDVGIWSYTSGLGETTIIATGSSDTAETGKQGSQYVGTFVVASYENDNGTGSVLTSTVTNNNNDIAYDYSIAYAVLPLAGWSKGNFLGVPNANIYSIMGVPKSQIAKVCGV